MINVLIQLKNGSQLEYLFNFRFWRWVIYELSSYSCTNKSVSAELQRLQISFVQTKPNMQE